jgi:hypothetical protein
VKQYHDIMDAIHLLKEARRALNAEDGPSITSPAWTLITHAQRYLMAQANAILRGDEYFQHRGECIALKQEMSLMPMTDHIVEMPARVEASY